MQDIDLKMREIEQLDWVILGQN